MGRSQESFNKKEVRKNKEKKRKEKEQKRLSKKDSDKTNSFEDMIAYVDENGLLTTTPPDPTKKSNVKLEDIEISVRTRDDSQKPDPMRKGVVSMFNNSKGYGFIRDMESKESIFVHINNLLEEVKEGNLVSFEVEKGPKGLTAVRVKLAEKKSNPVPDIPKEEI
jgi:cold shock CspA family protein